MRNAPDRNSAAESANVERHLSIRSPRQQRALMRLMRGPAWREEIDRVAGTSNGPDVIGRLRKKGLEVPCEQLERIDRDGRRCRPGLYSLTPDDRRMVRQWLAQRGA